MAFWCSNRQPFTCDAALRGVPGDRLAPFGVASLIEGTADTMGRNLTLKRAVFLDRDGVINEAIIRDGKPYPPAGAHETVIVPDAQSSLSRLKQHGFLLIVVTNQPDVARRTVSQGVVEGIHQFLSSHLPLDDFFAFTMTETSATVESPCPVYY
jgi:hypothetical protein